MMGRFYSDAADDDSMPFAFWEANLERAIGGRRGQALLRELEAALLALPEPKLSEGLLYQEGGDPEHGELPGERACAIGAVLRYRVLNGKRVVTPYGGDAVTTLKDLARFDAEEYGYEHAVMLEAVGAPANLAWHLGWLNDEKWEGLEPEARFTKMLEWVRERLKPEAVPA